MLITHNFGLVAEVADKVAIMYAGEIVEQGDVFEIFDNPLHPYTRLLMKALPRVTKHQARLQTIDGTVPRITEKSRAVAFVIDVRMQRRYVKILKYQPLLSVQRIAIVATSWGRENRWKKQHL